LGWVGIEKEKKKQGGNGPSNGKRLDKRKKGSGAKAHKQQKNGATETFSPFITRKRLFPCHDHAATEMQAQKEAKQKSNPFGLNPLSQARETKSGGCLQHMRNHQGGGELRLWPGRAKKSGSSWRRTRKQPSRFCAHTQLTPMWVPAKPLPFPGHSIACMKTQRGQIMAPRGWRSFEKTRGVEGNLSHVGVARKRRMEWGRNA